MKKILITLALSLALLFSFAGCGGGAKFLTDDQINQAGVDKITGTITVKYNNDEEIFNFELYYKQAPITVTNFVNLVSEEFYKDTVCYRFKDYDNGAARVDFGGYTADWKNEEDGPGYRFLKEKTKNYKILGEFSDNGWKKNEDLKNTTGVMAMALGNGNNSASVNFFVNIGTNTDNDGKVATFGKITNTSDLQVFMNNVAVSTGMVKDEKGNDKYSDVPEYNLTISNITIDNLSEILQKIGSVKKA